MTIASGDTVNMEFVSHEAGNACALPNTILLIPRAVLVRNKEAIDSNSGNIDIITYTYPVGAASNFSDFASMQMTRW